jgi:hypothetical protein
MFYNNKLLIIIVLIFFFIANLFASSIISSMGPMYKPIYQELVEMSDLVVIGEVQKSEFIHYRDDDERARDTAGEIISVKVKKKIFGKETNNIIYIIMLEVNPDIQNTYILKENKEILFFLREMKTNLRNKELSRIKDLPEHKYYMYGDRRHIYDLSDKKNQEFAKNIEEVMNVLQIKDIDLKIEKISKMLEYPEKYNTEVLILQIAYLHSPRAIPILKKYLKENIENKEQCSTIDMVIYHIVQMESMEVVNFAIEMLTEKEGTIIGKKMLDYITRYQNYKVKKYLYEQFKKNRSLKDIALNFISKQNITGSEIEYLKEILLDINETTENRLLAAELISKVKDKDLINRVIEILELVRYDKNENIAKKAVEYIKSLKERSK